MQYRSLYCGLCHSLKKNYGCTGMACLNYEVVFILMLVLSVETEEKKVFHGSCSMTPFLRVPFVDYLASDISTAAAITLLVSDYEIKDQIADSNRTIWKAIDHILSGRSARAKEELSVFEKKIRDKVLAFYACEQDPDVEFTQITEACGELIESIFEPLLMYIDSPLASTISRIANYAGQWIYLMDACDDFEKDRRNGDYNPLYHIEDRKKAGDRIVELQRSISELAGSLPMTQYEELVSYYINVCLPYNSGKVLEKFERVSES